jgi:hypothetical protein
MTTLFTPARAYLSGMHDTARHNTESRDFEAIAQRLAEEDLLTVAQAARHVPRLRGKRTSPSTLIRWIIHGKRGVYLDGVRLSGKTWWTSAAAVARFTAALTRASVGGLVRAAEQMASESPAGRREKTKRVEAARGQMRELMGKRAG